MANTQAAATSGGSPTAASAGGSQRGRVDVHRHLLLPQYVEMLARDLVVQGWSERMNPPDLLADMDEAGITTAILSPSTAVDSILADQAASRRFCRENNEYLAELSRDNPGRIGFFAVLPTPDVDGCLEEAAYALDELGADGVELFTSQSGKWLADPSLEPLYAELDRRRALVYTHPKAPTCCVNLISELSVSDAVIEYGTDTTRAIMQLVFGGFALRYPSITWIFSHAGGTMPALVERFVNLARTPQFAEVLPEGFLPVAARFYYDTAQSSNAAALSALKVVAPLSHVVFGTDFPWRTGSDHVENLRSCGLFDEGEIEAIEWTNPRSILPRVATLA